jgi:ribulose-phosphate 3-epimerase
MVRIAPSLLAADFGDLRGQIALAEKGGADWIHVDVMDGHFVPNLTVGPVVVRAIRRSTALPLDVHLMIDNPDDFLEPFRSAGADVLTVHYEACPNPHRTLQRIRELGAKPGVSVNPATPASLLKEILPHVDLVLVMTVNPGFGAQQFIPTTLPKIGEVASMLRGIRRGVFVEVDGGIDRTTAPQVVRAGANVLVAGNFIFGAADIPAAVRALRESAEPPLMA